MAETNKNEGKYVTNRDVTIPTKKGHTLVFKKDEHRYVPPACRREMLQHGILPVDGDVSKALEPKGSKDTKTVEPPTDEERYEIIKQTMRDMRGENNPADFTAANLPKDAVLEKRVGFKVDGKERKDIYAELLQK